jgi:hypothetical protein
MRILKPILDNLSLQSYHFYDFLHFLAVTYPLRIGAITPRVKVGTLIV